MMEISRVSAQEYKSYFAETFHVFNSVEFTELNKNKCEDVYYLIFKDKKVRVGIILGKRGNVLYSPFSAPFGGFLYIKKDIRLEYIEEALSLLAGFAKDKNFSVKISLMPSIYDSSLIAKEISVFSRSVFNLAYVDLNYHFSTRCVVNYENVIDRSAKKNLHNSFKQEFQFEKLNTKSEEDVKRAYRIIQANRESKGYPLRMSLESVLDTVKVIKADFFILSLKNEEVAAAQVFHISEGVVQVIYWGDVPGFSELRVMNYLAYQIFQYYYSTGIKIVDIGPSTENGIPNYGLCEFKENIGCEVSEKYTYFLE